MNTRVAKLDIPHTMQGDVVTLTCEKCQAVLGRKTGVPAWVLRVRVPIRGVCSIAACKVCLSELTATYKRIGCNQCTREVVEQMQLLRTEVDIQYDQIMLVHVHCSSTCRDLTEADIMRKLGKDTSRVCGSCGKATDQRCSGCGVGMFCTKACMKKGWDAHKDRCKRIKHYNEIAKKTAGAHWGLEAVGVKVLDTGMPEMVLGQIPSPSTGSVQIPSPSPDYQISVPGASLVKNEKAI
jgi:hypothetical protein